KGNRHMTFVGGIMCMVAAQELLRQILLISDAAHCESCPEDQFPDKDKDQCIAKKLHFLAYQETLGYILLGVGFEFSQGERRVYPSFFRINPKESPQYVGLVQLLLHFQWNWVGLLAPGDDRGERFISTLMPMLKEKEICLAFTQMLELDNFVITRNKFILNFRTWSKAEVFILFADSTVISTVMGAVHVVEEFKKVSFRKICIFTSHWKFGVEASESTLTYIKLFHGVLNFRDHSGNVSEFSHFLLSLDPLNPQGDVFLPQ
ncbi:hypothetical protein E2320_022151, partial [Naja naja]